MYTKHLSTLEFFTYAAFLAVIVVSISALLPGRKPPVRTEPYPDEELGAHDTRLPKYFLAGGAFLAARRVAHDRQEPPLDRRVARACRLRGPPRPRSLEHARDDRRRRHAHLHRALLVRVAARRRPSAREPGARSGRVLVHGRRSARVLRRAGRERHRDRPPRLRRLGLRSGQAAHGQGLPGARRDRRRDHGNRLLVLRRQRVPHDLPGPARSRAEADAATSGSSSRRARPG